MKKISTLSFFLLQIAFALAQQNIAPQDLFKLIPAERAVFDPPSGYSHTWGQAFEDFPLRRLWEAFDTGVPPQPLSATGASADWLDINGGGSQNHSLLWIGESALANAIKGDAAQYDIAADNCMLMLSFNKQQGHMRYEAVGFYAGFWEGGVASMALAGLYAPAGSTKGPALLAAARDWWADHIAVLRELSMPDGQVHLVGARSYGDPQAVDDYENISIAVNLQLIDPRPYSSLHPRIASLLTTDGQPKYGNGSVWDIQWHNYRHVAERWVVLRAVQTGAITRVPVTQSKPKMAHDYYKWSSGNTIYVASNNVVGLCPIRWKASWNPGQLNWVEIAGDDPNDCGQVAHPPMSPLNMPGNAAHILQKSIVTTSNAGCVSTSSCSNDASVISIVMPYNKGCAGTITPRVVIKNEGTNTMTDVALYCQIDGYTLYSEFGQGAIKGKRYTATTGPGLLPDSTITLSLDAVTVTPGTHTIKVWIMDVNRVMDVNSTNDLQTLQFNAVSTGAPSTFSENFENINPGSIPADWSLYNPDNTGNWFVYSTGTNKAAAFNNFAYTGAKGKKDELIMPPVDLTGNPQVYLSFDWAHASKPAPTLYDSMEVLISTDCGATFTSLWGKGGTALNTVADMPSLYIPAGPADYRNEKVDVSAYNTSVNAIFKFVNWSNNGNSTLIDNVNFTTTSPTSVNGSIAGSSVNVFPNPVSDLLQISYELPGSGEVQVKLVNALGQVVQETHSGVAGLQVLKMDVSNCPSGIYNVLLSSDRKSDVVSKVIMIAK